MWLALLWPGEGCPVEGREWPMRCCPILCCQHPLPLLLGSRMPPVFWQALSQWSTVWIEKAGSVPCPTGGTGDEGHLHFFHYQDISWVPELIHAMRMSLRACKERTQWYLTLLTGHAWGGVQDQKELISPLGSERSSASGPRQRKKMKWSFRYKKAIGILKWVPWNSESSLNHLSIGDWLVHGRYCLGDLHILGEVKGLEKEPWGAVAIEMGRMQG